MLVTYREYERDIMATLKEEGKAQVPACLSTPSGPPKRTMTNSTCGCLSNGQPLAPALCDTTLVGKGALCL